MHSGRFGGGGRRIQSPVLATHGDSLTVNSPGRWPTLLAALRVPLGILDFAVGGTTVLQVRATVLGMTAAQMALTQYICFGMPDTADGQDYIDAVDDVMEFITHDRVILCTPVTGNYAALLPGGAYDAGRLAAEAYILATYPNNAFDIHQALIDANDGSAGDLADVANDITPRSLRTDEVHWNDAGHEVVADAVFAFVQAKGWLIAEG